MDAREISQLRRRAESNFKSAIHSLKRALPKDTQSLSFETDSIDVARVETEAARLERYMEEVIQIRTSVQHNESRNQKAKEVVRKWFRASYPCANLFLTLAKEGSSVGALSS